MAGIAELIRSGTVAGEEVGSAIDGVPVRDVGAYRVESPLFVFGPLPEDNIFGAPVGTTSPAVDAGVYLLLAPLPPGPCD